MEVRRVINLLKALCYKVGIIADFVIERNKSGNWNYEKWYSGKCVATIYSQLTGVAVTTTYGSFYRSATYNYNLPKGLFTSVSNAYGGG